MRVFAFIFCLSICFTGFGQQLRIGVLNETNTKTIIFSVVQGSYLMTADNHAIQNLKIVENIFITREGDSVHCFMTNKDFGLFQTVRFSAMTDTSIFSLRTVDPVKDLKFFDGNLELSMKLGKLQTVNLVDIDKYLAGVVESEGGFKAALEYYKSQALLCRTYALSHLDRHTEEGFSLCDGVHCQAYNGRCSGTPVILKASFDTRGLVITGTDTTFITAAFHSNCGGETESAQNVWLIKKPYLKPVQDPYCQNQKNSRWEKKLSLDQWKQYLSGNGFKLKPNIAPSSFNYVQYNRKQYYKLGNDSVTFRKIRTDFNLHSAFFSVELKENNIELHGRGYGHGVGLCQEGAMQMAKLGYNFREIIQFYFSGVNIMNFRDVPIEKNATLKLLKQ